MISILRALLFYVLLYSVMWIILIPTIPLAFLPSPKLFFTTQRAWVFILIKMWEITLGIKYDIQGKNNITVSPVIYAAKHQSAWEIGILRHVIPLATFVTKRELLWIPIFNVILWRFSAIGLNRSAGRDSLRKLISGAKKALDLGHPLIIFPEGTRTDIGTHAKYQPGIFYIYDQLKVPVIPVATNAGYFWPRRKIVKKSGTATLEFLEPMPMGLNRRDFMALLEERIETASQKLLHETQQNNV